MRPRTAQVIATTRLAPCRRITKYTLLHNPNTLSQSRVSSLGSRYIHHQHATPKPVTLSRRAQPQTLYSLPHQTYRYASTDSAVAYLALERHRGSVQQISGMVRHFYKLNQKFRINHGSTNSTRSASKGTNIVDTSALKNVISIDTVRKTCVVEPNVPMDRLVEATMKHGLVPPVVMEFPGITVGGGYSGTSGESSSFRHGFFDRTCNWVEMVLADGEVVKLSREDKADLLHGAAGAVGTFGVTTLVEIQLHDAKDYVETTYHPVGGMKEAIEKLEACTRDGEADYVDGIMYSLTSGVIITGKMTNTPSPSLAVQRFSAASDPWFYMHAQSKITSPSTTPIQREAIPLAEYLFRYDRGGFWVGRSAFSYFSFPFNKFTRWWLDDFLHTRMMYTALHASGESKKYVVQDLALPYATAERFVEYTNEKFGIWPLWLCPLKQSPLPTMHPHSAERDEKTGELRQMLNIGLWGPGPEKHADFIEANRDLERKLKELGGMKWFYAHTYYDETEFWEMFDREWYDALRKKYKAEALTSVYEKVKVDVEAEVKAAEARKGSLLSLWPFAGFYGIWKAIQSNSYRAARDSKWKKFGRK